MKLFSLNWYYTNNHTMSFPIKHSRLPLLTTLWSLNWAINQQPSQTYANKVSKGGWVSCSLVCSCGRETWIQGEYRDYSFMAQTAGSHWEGDSRAISSQDVLLWDECKSGCEEGSCLLPLPRLRCEGLKGSLEKGWDLSLCTRVLFCRRPFNYWCTPCLKTPTTTCKK